jgi:hypothetical protein
VERGAADPSLSSVCGRGRQGVKLEQRTCLSRTSRIGGTVRDGLKTWNSETPTPQYIIYNIKMGLFKSARHPEKTDPAERVLTLSLPPPVPTRKNHPHPTQKRLPIKTSSSPMRCPRGRFPKQTQSTNELCGPRRGFVSRTNKRPRVSTVKNTNLKPSCRRAGTTTKSSPHQTQPDVYP